MGRREKPLDPGAGAVQRFAYALRTLRDEAGTPTYRAMAARAGYSGPTLSAAAAGERLPTLPVLRAYVTACGGDTEDWERRWHTAAAEAVATPVPDDETDSPYPGLARFGTADREHFHGRDDLVAELAAHTSRTRVCAVVGASGSGKSSLLRAGLIPELSRRTDLVEPPAAIRVLTPGPHPARTHQALFTPHDGPGDTILVVDQFEEVFVLCTDPTERALFLDRLLTALDPASRLRVVLAVRADFYGRCADHPELAHALRGSTLLLGPMTEQQLREAVVRPAAAHGLVVERALSARIVADVAGEPGGLPLMAHALREVWRRRTAKTLTVTAYDAVGGVRGAVAHTAEDVYSRCTTTEAATLRALLLRLVTPGDGAQDTRRPADRTELDTDDTTARVLERLVRARLLTVDGSTVDLAHEALLQAWPRLRRWIDADRERLRAHRRLTEAACAWDELKRDPGALYRGVRLAEAREMFHGPAGSPDLNHLEHDFIAASVASYEHGRRTAARAARRLRGLIAALAVLLCLALVAGAVAWRQSGISARQRDEAEARRVAALAGTLRATEPGTALRLAVAAWHTADLPETRQALRSAAAQSERDVFAVPEEGGRLLHAPFWLSSDGRILTTLAHDRAVQWDVRTHRRIRSVRRAGLSAGVSGISADGRLVAYRGPNGADLLIGDLTDGTTHRLGTGNWTDTDGALGPSGRTFLVRRQTRGERATLDLWDVRRQRLLFRYDRGDRDGPLPVLSPDERHLAWCTGYGGRLRVLDAGRQRLVAVPVPAATERLLCRGDELTFTSDSRAVATVASDAVVTWDFHTGRERPRLPLPGGTAVEFAGDYALTWSAYTSLALWRTDLPAPADDGPREPLLTFPLATPSVTGLRLDLADGVLRYQEQTRTSAVGTLALNGLVGGAWRAKAATRAAFDRQGRPVRPAVAPSAGRLAVDPSGRLALTAEGALVDDATGRRSKGARGVAGEDILVSGAFSPDGRYAAVADFRGRVTLWDARAWRRTAVLRAVGSTTRRTALAFSADGSLLAAGAPDGSVEVWETASPRLPAARLPVGDGPVLALGFSPDSEDVHVATAHLADRTSPLAPARAAATVCARAGRGLTEAEWHRYLTAVSYRRTCNGA
ncbi:nSTAND1 domain-containing NTPase [Streptomyces sp. NPDC002671]